MRRDLDRRIRFMLVSQSIYTFGAQLIVQYNTLFAQTLGASGSDIGLINFISSGVQGALSMQIGLAIERHSIKKIMLLGLLCDISAMAILILAALLHTPWFVLIPAFILYFQLIRFLPFADMIVVLFTNRDKRATVLGLSRLLRGVVGLVAPVIASAVVTYYGGISPEGIFPLYCISLTIFMSVFLLTSKFFPETKLGNNVGKLSLKNTNFIREYSEFFRDKNVRRWILIKLFARDGFQFMLTIFVPLWLVNIKGATPIELGLIALLSSVTDMLFQVPAGKLADKIGRRRAFFIFTMFYCLGVSLLIWSPSHEYLMIAAILGGATGSIVGGIGGAAFTPFITMWWEIVPTESKGKLYGLDNLLITVSRAPAAMIGGILWDVGFKELTLLIPVFVELFIVVPLIFMLPKRTSHKDMLSQN
jgi:MFS family permease